MAPARPSRGTHWEAKGGAPVWPANAGNAHTTSAASPSMAIRVFRIFTSSLAFPDSEFNFGRTNLWNLPTRVLVFRLSLERCKGDRPLVGTMLEHGERSRSRLRPTSFLSYFWVSSCNIAFCKGLNR